MRRRTATLLPLALAAALTVSAGAGAQAEAQRRLDAALERVRAALGPDGELTVQETSVNPVSGEALLRGVALRRGEHRARIESLVLNDVGAERVGTAAAQGLQLGIGAKSGATRIARANLAGLRLPAPGTPWDWGALALDNGVLEAVESDGEQGDRLGIGRVAVEGYAPGILRAATIEGATLNRSLPDGRVSVARLGRLTATGLVLPAPGAVLDPLVTRADAAGMEGLSIDDPANGVVLSLGRLDVREWGEGRSTAAEIAGLSVAVSETAAGPLDMRLGRAAMTGVPLRDAVAAFLAGVVPARIPPGQGYGLDANGLELDLAGTRLLGIGALTARGGTAATGEQTGSIGLDGVVVVPPAEQAWVLGDLGYERFSGALSVEGRLAEPDNRLNGTLRLGGDGMGVFAAAFRLGGWPPTPLPGTAADGEAMVQAMAAALLESLDLRYEEQGLVGRLMALAARRSGVPEAQFRAQMASIVLNTPLPAAPSPTSRPGKVVRRNPAGTAADAPPVAAIRQALARFLRGEATAIEFAARPPAPVPVAGLVLAGDAPATLVETLGITANAR